MAHVAGSSATYDFGGHSSVDHRHDYRADGLVFLLHADPPVGKFDRVIGVAMEHRWYAIQTTAGHENKVRGLIDRRIQDDPTPEEERFIRQALVPTEQVPEIKDGKKITVERKKYPGYVLVDMVLNQDTIHVVNGIQGVIKFVGQGWTPQPIRPDEVNRLLGIKEEVDEQAPEEEIPFIEGQIVEIMEGPFSDFSGTVERVMPDKGKVCVSVSLFGRPTTVELDYLQLKAQ